MSVISSNKHTNKLYYSSESNVGKQTLAYISVSNNSLLAIDVTKTKVIGTQWKELAENLNLTIGQLVNKKHPSFTKTYRDDMELDETDWIKVLNKHPEVLVYPIILIEGEWLFIKNPSDITKYMHPIGNSIDEKKYL